MAIILCPNCHVANPDGQAMCHCCGARFKGGGAQDNFAAYAVEAHCRQLQQNREAKLTSKWLLTAAVFLLVRGTVYPLILSYVPPDMLRGLDPHSIQILSYSAGAAIFAMYLLARTKPLPAAAMAITVYVAICIPDLMTGEGFLGKGIVSKVVMAGPLGRALSAGIMHWLYKPRMQALPAGTGSPS